MSVVLSLLVLLLAKLYRRDGAIICHCMLIIGKALYRTRRDGSPSWWNGHLFFFSLSVLIAKDYMYVVLSAC